MNAIVQTTTEATRHGDAHAKNVLVYEVATKYEKQLKIKLCDFGTSLYSGKEASEQRHWRIVRETIIALTEGIPHARACRELLDRNWPKAVQLAAEAYESRKAVKNSSGTYKAVFLGSLNPWEACDRRSWIDLRGRLLP